MIKTKPVGPRVLIAVDQAEDMTEGGLYKPEEAKEREQQKEVRGTIVAVGDMAWVDDLGNRNPYAKVGDRVVFAKYGGVDFEEDDGKYYRVMNDEDVLAVING